MPRLQLVLFTICAFVAGAASMEVYKTARAEIRASKSEQRFDQIVSSWEKKRLRNNRMSR